MCEGVSEGSLAGWVSEGSLGGWVNEGSLGGQPPTCHWGPPPTPLQEHNENSAEREIQTEFIPHFFFVKTMTDRMISERKYFDNPTVHIKWH